MSRWYTHVGRGAHRINLPDGGFAEFQIRTFGFGPLTVTRWRYRRVQR